MIPPSVIQVEGLAKKYGETYAVGPITFDIPADRIVGLLGGNGAGKTTTLSMLIGVLLPTAGTIHILGIDMIRHRHLALKEMNFSSPYIDLPQRLSVRENLAVFSHLYNVPHYKDRITELARELDLTGFLDRPYGSLSAGQKTRVSLAKALINSPMVLLLDEPTASLDPDTADWIRTYLQSYQKRTGATILLASHNMREVEMMCDDVIVMKSGRIADQGSPDALVKKYGREDMEEVFLHIARNEVQA